MADIIRLLPDSVANQIAAGEVIQRPASAVKELLENAVDAGSSRIQLIIRDAGKTLIQVIDDGSGMSETDARLSFERHATSKIRKVDDLYSLYTMGFRGEALASIASVAQVELKSRIKGSEIGTRIVIEGSECKGQDPVAIPEGSSMSVKNLFYNVPARRNFLKSNPVETRHILEEFTRIALSNPHIHFSLHHNDLQLFDVRSGNFRQRIASIFGTSYNERLVPVEEDTSIVRVEGFIGKPEFAKKTRGEQYFFVNNRFIKDNYLHHAITAAFESLITRDSYPSYWLKITIDPAAIDVNIHPTKTEIKFQDDKSVYAILRAAVKRALGRFSIAPSLDFDRERSFDIPLEKMNSIPVQPGIRVDPNFNPFRTDNNPNSVRIDPFRSNDWKQSEHQRIESWNRMHESLVDVTVPVNTATIVPDMLSVLEDLGEHHFSQSGLRLMLISHVGGLVIIDIQQAHERILFERYLNVLENQQAPSQQQLFPPRLQLNHDDAALLNELHDDLRRLGFDLSDFGNNVVVVQGIPSDIESGQESIIIQQLLEQYRNNLDRLKVSSRENIARSMAKSVAVKSGRILGGKELKQLALDLLTCDQSRYSVNGKTILVNLTPDELLKLF